MILKQDNCKLLNYMDVLGESIQAKHSLDLTLFIANLGSLSLVKDAIQYSSKSESVC